MECNCAPFKNHNAPSFLDVFYFPAKSRSVPWFLVTVFVINHELFQKTIFSCGPIPFWKMKLSKCMFEQGNCKISQLRGCARTCTQRGNWPRRWTKAQDSSLWWAELAKHSSSSGFPPSRSASARAFSMWHQMCTCWETCLRCFCLAKTSTFSAFWQFL